MYSLNSSLLQKPQHISKIVEYFERKQGGNGTSTISHKLDFLDSPNRFSSFPASVRRNWLQSDTQSITRSSLDYYTRRKLFEKPFTGGSHVLSKRSTNQRLLICEGAVKSKLPIFDKKWRFWTFSHEISIFQFKKKKILFKSWNTFVKCS